MKQEDFDFISGVLKERSGLVLNADKIYLLESRLTPLARQKGMETLDDLIKAIRSGTRKDMLEEVTEAMTTNESFFFRDKTPFDLFKQHVMPTMQRARGDTKKLRIWCAAASTGQEPYSLAILLKEQEALWKGWKIEIIATDLSTQVLEKAKTGLYSQFEVQRGLPIQSLVKHFSQVGEMWQINDDLRSMVTFRPFNLLDNYRTLGKFDVIFCRNVLIYFDQKTKTDVLNRMREIVPDDGNLFLGAAETVLGLTDQFKPVPNQRGLYVTTEKVSPALRVG